MEIDLKKVAFLFDVDGVIADTPHEQAWRDAALEWKIINPSFNFTPFYASHVAGEPGNTGAMNILNQLHEDGKPTYFERENITSHQEKDRLAREFRNPVKTRHLESYIEKGKFHIYKDVAKIVLEAKRRKISIEVVSSSEYASVILKNIRIGDLAVGTDHGFSPEKRYQELFGAEALGALRYWHGCPIDKINHYAMAYGKLMGTIGCDDISKIVVFEDAPKGIAAVKKLGFFAVGISRVSTSGVCLASVADLKEAGADIAFDEEQLARITFDSLVGDILKCCH